MTEVVSVKPRADRELPLLPGWPRLVMPVERVMDTILGAALGIGFAVLFSTLDDRRQLAQLRARESGTRH